MKQEDRTVGSDHDVADQPLDAGAFGSWIEQIGIAIEGGGEADVPCGTCTACCTASQFIHIAPHERRTLKRVPKALLFPAPRLPAGHVLMPYDERGHCPMLIDNACSIYDDRPQTCRTYDCRVFPASGLTIGDKSKALVARQAERWRFSYLSDDDALTHDAALAAGRFLSEHRDMLVELGLATNATQLAVLAVEIHRLFLAPLNEAGLQRFDPDEDAVRAELVRRRAATPSRS